MRYLLTLALLLNLGCDQARYASSTLDGAGPDPAAPAPDPSAPEPDGDARTGATRLAATALLDLDVTTDGDPVVAYIDAHGLAQLASLAPDWAWQTALPAGVSALDDRDSHRFDLVMDDPTQAYVCHVEQGRVRLSRIDGVDHPTEVIRVVEVTSAVQGCRVVLDDAGEAWLAWSHDDHGFIKIAIDNVERGTTQLAGDADPDGYENLPMPFAVAVDEHGPAALITSQAGLWAWRGNEVDALIRYAGVATHRPVGLEIVRNGTHWAQVQRWDRPNTGYSTTIWRLQADTLVEIPASHALVEQQVRTTGWGLTTQGVPVLVSAREGELLYHLDPDATADPPPRVSLGDVGPVRSLQSVVGPDDRLHIVYVEADRDLLVHRTVDLRR